MHVSHKIVTPKVHREVLLFFQVSDSGPHFLRIPSPVEQKEVVDYERITNIEKLHAGMKHSSQHV